MWKKHANNPKFSGNICEAFTVTVVTTAVKTYAVTCNCLYVNKDQLNKQSKRCPIQRGVYIHLIFSLLAYFRLIFPLKCAHAETFLWL